MEELVRVEGVSKKFCRDLKTSLWYGVKDISSELVGIKGKHHEHLRKHEFWAVDNVSFSLNRGDCLGLIGHNGAGKSTLLKMLNGLITPDKGLIKIRGRVAAIIELGAGFNPILTGRENIYNNGVVLGIRKREIDDALDAIIEFSGLKDFIDTPVQYYSSGMKVRLGFSVAVHLKPDVLILDEVLAVGDAGFRIKSFNKISEMMRNAAVIFVSHSMPSVARICNHGSYMSHGIQKYQGNSVQTAIGQYFADFEGEKAIVEYDSGATIDKVFLNGGESKAQVRYGEDLKIDLEINLKQSADNFYVMVQITDKDMKIVGQYFSNLFHDNFEPLEKSQITFELKDINFIDGDYAITYFIAEEKENGNYEFLATYRYLSTFRMMGLSDTLFASVHLFGKVYQNGKILIEKNQRRNEKGLNNGG
ncbi:ABC transporter ATP-binding protein [Cryomorphaceae bacterium 1068]|nr:ABC transporter ATP-binding protein [Cryomorphaceae bacterium 1068]